MAFNRQNRWRLQRLIPGTIMGQLTVSAALVQIVVLGIFLVVESRSQEQFYTARNHDRAVVQSRLLASQAADAMRRGDRAQMAALTEAMRSSSAVLAARLTDMEGNTLAVSQKGEATIDGHEKQELQLALRTGNLARFQHSRNWNESVMPVIVDGRPIGLAWIHTDVSNVSESRNQLIRMFVLYALYALLANLLLVALLASTIVGPLTRLSRATQQIVRDSNDPEGFPLPITTTNEAGQLTHNFNAMVRELQLQRSGLQETLALLDSMLENAPVGFAFFDRKHRYVRANQFLERMYENHMHLHLGQTMGEIFPGQIAVKLEETVEHVFRSGQDVHNLEVRGVLRAHDTDADERVWICNFYPVRKSRERIGWVGMVMVEVTGRVRQEEAMRRSEKLAAAGRLAASIAHEINNPLESVTNLLYLLRHHPSLDLEAQEFAAMAQRELSRVSEITQQTLRFYRSSTRAEKVRLSEIVESVLTLHAARIHGAKVTVTKRLDPDAVVYGFAGELRQVLANIIGNAVDAMQGGGKLAVRVTRLAEGVSITVADTGSGMSPQTRQHIFEPFFTTKDTTGTGLGLWVSAEIIAKHGGKVHVRSREAAPSGTIFRVFFPTNGLRTERATEFLPQVSTAIVS